MSVWCMRGAVPPTGAGNQGTLPRVPSVRGPPNSAGVVQVRSIRQSHSSLASFGFAVFLTEVSLLFCFEYAADAKLSYVATAQSAS